jgi:hypothetical protein
VTGLADLPPRRRAYLLRYYANARGTEPEDVDWLVRRATGSCYLPDPVRGITHPSLAPYVGSRSPIARIRQRLIELSGPLCFTCRERFGECVDHDHDHDSNLVRGLLCICCNNNVDKCLHLNNCAYADYLAAPPAIGLVISYPNRGRTPHAPILDAEGRRARREAWSARRTLSDSP